AARRRPGGSTPINDPGLRLFILLRRAAYPNNTHARALANMLTDLRPHRSARARLRATSLQSTWDDEDQEAHCRAPPCPSMRSGENDQCGEVRAIARNRRFLTAINTHTPP